MNVNTATFSIEVDEDYPEIRDSVRRVCADFPGAYWRKLEEAEAYPSEFVKALTEVTLGIMPGAGGTQNLPRAIGERRAKEIIMTGKPFDAAQALDWGLINQVHAPAEVLAKALETAATIAGNAPLSVRQVKKSIRYGGQMELRTAYRFEVEAYNHLIDTEDRMEGVKAFNEKRKPVFKGR